MIGSCLISAYSSSRSGLLDLRGLSNRCRSSLSDRSRGLGLDLLSRRSDGGGGGGLRSRHGNKEKSN
jgi:hypothetical protein